MHQHRTWLVEEQAGQPPTRRYVAKYQRQSSSKRVTTAGSWKWAWPRLESILACNAREGRAVRGGGALFLRVGTLSPRTSLAGRRGGGGGGAAAAAASNRQQAGAAACSEAATQQYGTVVQL